MTDHLSQSDVARLLNDPSPEVRADTAAKVARQFQQASLTEYESQIAEEIFRALLRDAEVRVRQALADHLKDSPKVPHDVAVSLARDVEEVALPMLEYSDVLTDDDLIEIVRSQSVQKQLAIEQRNAVSSAVADALVDTENEQVVVTLVSNDGAKIEENTFHKVIGRFANSEPVQAGLVHRASLPVAISERLITMVSESLRDQLVARHEVPPDMLDDMVLRSRERAVLGISTASGPEDVERLVRHLNAQGRLTPSLILRALCMGDILFFETSLAVLAGVSNLNAAILIHDQGSRGLAAIYAQARLPEALFPAVRQVVEIARETHYDGEDNDREQYSSRMIERILTDFDGLGAENLEYLLTRLDHLAGPTPPSVG